MFVIINHQGIIPQSKVSKALIRRDIMHLLCKVSPKLLRKPACDFFFIIHSVVSSVRGGNYEILL